MRVTSRDVAERAGVSQPTVSRVLRGDPRVRPETKDRILRAARDLSYVPDSIGRNLVNRTTGQVALVADLGNPFYPRLMTPVHDELAAAGYRMVLLSERNDEDLLSRHLLDRSVDGVVLSTVARSSRLPRELRRRGVPFVLLNRFVGGVAADRAVADNRSGAAEVAELLLGLGHRDIGLVMGPVDTSTGEEREQGFREVAARVGAPVLDRRVWHGGLHHEDGVAGFEAIAGRGPMPTALFCVNDFVAVGALNAAIEAGLRVPEDLSIVGFDDVSMAAWPCFDLTTVQVPVDAMARAATTLLIDRLRGDAPTRPRHRTFDTPLILRSSHAAPRTSPISPLS